MLITTHYMDEADKLCDRIAIVDHGELKALDSPMKLKASIPGKNVLEVSFSTRRRTGRSGSRGCPASRAVDGARPRLPPRHRQRSGDDAGADGAAARRGVTVQSLSVQSTTLDDVFVHYTGRALRDALQEAARSTAGPCCGEGVAMGRTWAIIEREMRRFRRSPMLIVMSMIIPIVQLVVLGYAFGGNVKHLKVAIVDQDHGVPAVRVRELASAASSGAQTFDTVDYADQGQALADLRNGRVNGVLTIPPDFSRRVLGEERAARRAHRGQHRQLRLGDAGGDAGRHAAGVQPPVRDAARSPGAATLDVVEVYPYVPYIQYLLPGSIVMSIFMMVMIGGGIIFIDDKARGLHEGYLVTPITKFELIAGFNISGTIKAVLAGMFLIVIGSLIAGDPESVRSDAAAPPVRGDRRHRVRADQPDVPADGARHRSAAAARRCSACSTRCCISRAARSTRSRAFRRGCR